MRGQITLFFLIGLVVLIIVGVSFLLLRPSAGSDTVDTVNAAVVTSVVGACLDTIVADELRIVGETGGLPSVEARPGVEYPSAIVPFGTGARRIIYGVTANRDLGDLLPGAHAPPRYPDTMVAIGTSHMFYDAALDRLVELQPFQGHFGDVYLPAICAFGGPNGPSSPLRCRNYPGMPPGTPGPSMQEQLAQRIASRVASCASPEMLSASLGQQVTSVGSPVANLTFTPTNILVKLTYPLELEGSVTTRVETTPRTYKVRLMPLMQFAHALAHAEARNVTFDPVRDAALLPEFRDGFIVTRHETVASEQRPSFADRPLAARADVILITDQRSEIDGVTYSYAFLVEDRPPMLNELPDPGQVICAALRGHRGDGFIGGIHAAADPDGDTISFQMGVDGTGYTLQAVDEAGSDWMGITSGQILAAGC